MTVPRQGTDPDPSVRRIVVPEKEPMIGSAPYDYADSFELRVAEPDPRSAEELARIAIEHAPWPVRHGVLLAWRALLRFRLGPLRAPDHILGARIVVSEHDVILLEVSGPLMRGAIVSRRIDPTCI